MAKATGEKLYLLTEADMAILRRVVEMEKRKPQNRPGPSEPPSEDNQRSGVFALIPAGGIPARTDNGDGTYTLHGAECQMYKEIWDDNDQRTLEIVEGWEEYVINHGDTEVAAGSLLPTEVTTQGTRFPVVGGKGHVVISFRILSIGPFLGDTAACETVLAEVLRVSCNGAGVEVGDEVIIYDPSGCYFNVPTEVLLNSHGTAFQTKWDDDPNSAGIASCFLLGYTGTGTTDLNEGECYWSVQTLSCNEDIYDYTP